MISSAHMQRSVHRLEVQQDKAAHRVSELQLQALAPDAATVSELSQLMLGDGVADALRQLKRAQRGLAEAMLPGARTAQLVCQHMLRATQQRWAPLQAKQAHHDALISAVGRVVPPVAVQLASDHLSAVCAASSERKRKRTHNTANCTRRAACVGTSAPAAPPVVVGQTHTTAQLCADQSGVAPPM